MPCILCGPGFPPESTGESDGSTATICTAGFSSFSRDPVPLTVPPVPTPATKMSTRPSVSRHISSAVVRRCTAGLAGFSNCWSITAPGVSRLSLSASAIAPFMPSAPGVSTRRAPRALSRLRLSALIVSGMVSTSLYPLEDDTNASPTPVLPLVGSMMVPPGLSIPRCSASSIIARAMRSFTLPAGLKYSSFAISRAPDFFDAPEPESSMRGVPPTRSVSLFAIFSISVWDVMPAGGTGVDFYTLYGRIFPHIMFTFVEILPVTRCNL